MKLSCIKNNLQWQVDLEREFMNRQTGYTFVIDVYDRISRLALYAMKRSYSESTILNRQPPRRLLDRAVREQGGSLDQGGLYAINKDIRRWIENNLLSQTTSPSSPE